MESKEMVREPVLESFSREYQRIENRYKEHCFVTVPWVPVKNVEQVYDDVDLYALEDPRAHVFINGKRVLSFDEFEKLEYPMIAFRWEGTAFENPRLIYELVPPEEGLALMKLERPPQGSKAQLSR